MSPFNYRQKVLFQHCDPAGMVFYPRYYEMLNATVEAWFDQIIKMDFFKLHSEMQAGIPTVSVDTQFTKPSYLGDQLTFSLMPIRLGTSSVTLRIDAYCDEELILSTQNTLVYIDMNTGKSQNWDVRISKLISKYLI